MIHFLDICFFHHFVFIDQHTPHKVFHFIMMLCIFLCHHYMLEDKSLHACIMFTILIIILFKLHVHTYIYIYELSFD
jgi:hypothetical protein